MMSMNRTMRIAVNRTLVLVFSGTFPSCSSSKCLDLLLFLVSALIIYKHYNLLLEKATDPDRRKSDGSE